MNISGPTKRTYVLLKFVYMKKKPSMCGSLVAGRGGGVLNLLHIGKSRHFDNIMRVKMNRYLLTCESSSSLLWANSRLFLSTWSWGVCASNSCIVIIYRGICKEENFLAINTFKLFCSHISNTKTTFNTAFIMSCLPVESLICRQNQVQINHR